MQSDPVNDFFETHWPPASSRDGLSFSPRMLCADGFSMSVQGHRGAYCSPRTDYYDHYTKVEVGFPSEREDLLMPYAEEPSDPTETVYGYVPVEVIAQVLEKHGGLAGPKQESAR